MYANRTLKEPWFCNRRWNPAGKHKREVDMLMHIWTYPCFNIIAAQNLYKTQIIFWYFETLRYLKKCQESQLISPRCAYMCQWIRSALVQIMTCRLFGAKPLSKATPGYCQLVPKEQISVIFVKIQMFSFTKMGLKMTAKWWPFCPWGRRVSTISSGNLLFRLSLRYIQSELFIIPCIIVCIIL